MPLLFARHVSKIEASAAAAGVAAAGIAAAVVAGAEDQQKDDDPPPAVAEGAESGLMMPMMRSALTMLPKPMFSSFMANLRYSMF